MKARIIDGRALALTMQAEIAARVAERIANGHPQPGLAAIQVGDNPASTKYVANKIRDCGKVGIASFHHPLPLETTESELVDLIGRLNADPAVHGILVQMPLPKHIDESTVISTVDPVKDVDGFHPVSLGRLASDLPGFVACTPLGVQQLLKRNQIATAGAHAVIVGRSKIVGKPLALLLMRKGPGGDATVTVAHSRSHDLKSITRSADILIAAIGSPRFITDGMIKPGATVIDVGTTFVHGKLVGDVDFDAAREVAGAISPVPGGVGPMTITMLLHNTLMASGG